MFCAIPKTYHEEIGNSKGKPHSDFPGYGNCLWSFPKPKEPEEDLEDFPPREFLIGMDRPRQKMRGESSADFSEAFPEENLLKIDGREGLS
jgi:hypothetical protein